MSHEESARSDVSSDPQKGFEMTRRRMIAITAGGAVLAVPAIAAVYRWGTSQSKALEITLKGPFKNYGYFKPEELGIDGVDDFEMLMVNFDQGKDTDRLYVQFTFKGKEDPSRKMQVKLSAFDNSGKCIAERKEVYEDPRIAAKEPLVLIDSKRTTLAPNANIGLNLPPNTKIGILDKITLEVINQEKNKI